MKGSSDRRPSGTHPVSPRGNPATQEDIRLSRVQMRRSASAQPTTLPESHEEQSKSSGDGAPAGSIRKSPTQECPGEGERVPAAGCPPDVPTSHRRVSPAISTASSVNSVSPKILGKGGPPRAVTFGGEQYSRSGLSACVSLPEESIPECLRKDLESGSSTRFSFTKQTGVAWNGLPRTGSLSTKNSQGSRAADGRFRISRKLDRRLRHEVPRLRGVASAAAEEANRAALNRGGSRFVAGVEANWAHFRALWGMDTFQMLRGSSTDPELRTLPVPYFEDPDKEAEFKAYTLSILPLRLVLGSVLCMLTEFSEIILAEVYDYNSRVKLVLPPSKWYLITLHHVIIGLQPIVCMVVMILAGFYQLRKHLEKLTIVMQVLSCLLCLADGIVPMAVARSIAVSGSHPEVVAFIGDRALADTMASVAVQMLIFNLIFPLRLMVSWPITVLYVVAAVAVFIVGIVGEDDGVATAAAVNNIVWTFVFAVICIISRYERELNSRAVWLDWKKSSRRVDELERRFLRPQNTPEGGLETISNYLRSTMEVVLRGKQQKHLSLSEVEDIESLLLPAMAILVSRKDLAKIRRSDLGAEFARDFMRLMAGEDREPEPPQRGHSGLSIPASSRSFSARVGRWSMSARISSNERAELFTRIGHEWTLDLLSLQDARKTAVLVVVGRSLLLPCRDRSLVAFSEMVECFLSRVNALYYPNPYHNAAHGAQVGHFTFCLLTMLGIDCVLTEVDSLSIAVAALSHDIAHPGRNNQFLINTAHHLAITYNDISVLENFHAATLFSVLGESDCSLFSFVSADMFREKRKIIIDLILATDMKKHFEEISLFRTHRQAPGFKSYGTSDDVWTAVSMCLKAADLGHASLPWDQHVRWSNLVVEEFYQQGDDEKSRGLPVSFLCDRVRDADLPKSQQGFLRFVVKPLFVELVALEDSDMAVTTNCMSALEANLKRWEELGEQQAGGEAGVGAE